MATLLLRLQGPMQSWGTRSRFDHRDTWPYPTKSGVLGLLAAALGRDREADISDLAALRMGVRVDRKGVLRVDYQTAREVLRADLKGRGNVQSWRYYLSDAAFLVGLEGPRPLLEEAHRALKNPRFVLYLGRKGYVPSPPPYLADGLREEPLEEALRSYPFLLRAKKGEGPSVQRRFGARHVREKEVPIKGTGPLLQEETQGEDPRPKEGFLLVLEAPEGRLVYDQPVAPFAQRRFGARYVREEVWPKEKVPLLVEEDHVDQQAGA